MRKLFYILLALPILLVACNKDNDGVGSDQRFIDGSLIAGTWSRVGSKDVTLLIYKDGKARTEHHYKNESKQVHYLGTYSITKQGIFYNDSNEGLLYMLRGDTLSLEYGSGSNLHWDAYVKIKED